MIVALWNCDVKLQNPTRLCAKRMSIRGRLAYISHELPNYLPVRVHVHASAEWPASRGAKGSVKSQIRKVNQVAGLEWFGLGDRKLRPIEIHLPEVRFFGRER